MPEEIKIQLKGIPALILIVLIGAGALFCSHDRSNILINNPKMLEERVKGSLIIYYGQIAAGSLDSPDAAKLADRAANIKIHEITPKKTSIGNLLVKVDYTVGSQPQNKEEITEYFRIWTLVRNRRRRSLDETMGMLPKISKSQYESSMF